MKYIVVGGEKFWMIQDDSISTPGKVVYCWRSDSGRWVGWGGSVTGTRNARVGYYTEAGLEQNAANVGLAVRYSEDEEGDWDDHR